MTKRILSVIMTVLMLLSLASCNLMNRISGKNEDKSKYITEAELARIVVNSINSTSQISDCYYSIPEAQRNDISYADYAQYIEALVSMVGDNGKIISFRFLDDVEETSVFQSLIAGKMSSEEFREYGSLDIVELLFDAKMKSNCYMYINVDDYGNAFLSSEWVKQTYRLHQFINVYFQEIESRNVNGVMSAIESVCTFTDSNSGETDYYDSDVIRSRAEALISFYRYSVRSERSAFELTSITPIYAKTVLPEVISSKNNKSFDTKNVEFTQRDGVVYVKDIVPISADIRQFKVRKSKGGFGELQIGKNYTDNSVVKYIGKPSNITIGSEPVGTGVNSNGEIEYKYKIIYTYQGGMRAIFEGYVSDMDARKWEGELIAIKIDGPCDFELEDYMTYGVTKKDLLVKYPFLDEKDYTMTYSSSGLDYKMSISYEFDGNNQINKIVAEVK